MKTKSTFFIALCLFSTSLFSQSSFEIAIDHLQKNDEYNSTDLSDVIISNEHKSDQTGITHLYLQQRYEGIEIKNSIANFSLRNGELISTAGNFIGSIEEKIVDTSPSLSATDALQKQLLEHNITGQIPEIMVSSSNLDHETIFNKGDIAHNEIKARLIYLRNESQLRLCWELSLYEKSCTNSWETYIDAMTGEILGEANLVIHCSFHSHEHTKPVKRKKKENYAEITLKKNAFLPGFCYGVYAYPVESPIHGPRTIEFSPFVSGPAGVLGWHDDGTSNYTTSKGNNVDAYHDQDANNSPTGGDDARVNGGFTYNFNYSINLSQHPNDNPNPYITNLFYWNNLMHDVWYQYGFTEAAGNFQESNPTGTGTGGDYVNAEAQDGSAMNNATFFTPADGANPRMQMFLWDQMDPSDPPLDSDLDNGIIAHEYGHGISIRLTGGANDVSCLLNQEQMGEGWSDFFGLWMTIEPNDEHDDSRGIGNYVEELGVDGGGIRLAPYTTSMEVNSYTYGDLEDVFGSHAIGFIWCTMIWDLNWALVNIDGLDSDIYFGTGGNNKTAQLIIEGMKEQPCSPGFVDARDAIITADQNTYGGVHSDIIWNVFARRGLGFSADQGSSGDKNDGTEAFDLPPGVPLLTYEELFENAPLPVEMLAFNAVPNNEKQNIELFWSTASELDNKGFDLQRRTEGSSLFESITWIDGQIDHSGLTNYTYKDESVEQAKDYYYRLRQVDLNGNESFSELVNARLKGLGTEIKVYPNPSEGISTVQFSNNIKGQINLQILNAQGQIIGRKFFESNGAAELELDISNQPEGIYFLKIEVDSKEVVKRIVLRK